MTIQLSMLIFTQERKKRKGQLQELEEIWMSNVNTLLDQQATARRNAKVWL